MSSHGGPLHKTLRNNGTSISSTTFSCLLLFTWASHSTLSLGMILSTTYSHNVTLSERPKDLDIWNIHSAEQETLLKPCNLNHQWTNQRLWKKIAAAGTVVQEVEEAQGLLTPGLDNTRLFMSLTAGAGTRCMSLLSSSPSLIMAWSGE